MAKKALPAPAATAESDPLAESINRLTGELGALRHVLEDIREDFSWLTRNGLPVQPVEHVIVKRMALDPCGGDWADKLQVERLTFPSQSATSPLDSDALDRIADDLKITFEAVAQGQLEVVLNALDGVRTEILSVIKRREAVASVRTVAAPTVPEPQTTTAADPPAPSAQPGRLF